ncbi:YggS family pyridoxal phosphate-dependent enzyme [Candidatus Berkiella aquae]|uniref:Pyridoxal phosphate homeostasis protein n=1 Tax=Candidatus Berkiella aquae TaxID=295108 RepID=A0A0Q9YN36_9GAMM|nr:YggS family pyridoxal phosphate-dependent enzyme [Candidatus Berkiella aquae]MCS5712610.1 YggS family pyridoxal phosphate-dependent enzyme [Candidatus Berkiella aquae]
MIDIVANLHHIQHRIETTCQQCERNKESVTLIAVSKSHSADQIAKLYAAGQHHFGENYLNEALSKITLLPTDILWHFIGTIQSKKTLEIAQNFSWVHTVCRLKEAQLLSQHRQGMPPLNICLQVKMEDDPKRNGIYASELMNLLKPIQDLPHLRLRGLMVLPPLVEALTEQRAYFQALHSLLVHCNQQGANLDTLSMGMTHDIDAAILEGATMVRIGTGIFGPREI